MWHLQCKSYDRSNENCTLRGSMLNNESRKMTCKQWVSTTHKFYKFERLSLQFIVQKERSAHDLKQI